MNLIEGILLGVVQGLTEFLPISSSGHLVLFQNILGFREPELLLNAALHLGTLLAVCIYFRSDLKLMIIETWNVLSGPIKKGECLDKMIESPHASIALWVLIGTVPTSIIGLVFHSPLENLFGSVTVVGIMLVVTGILLAISRLIPEHYNASSKVGLVSALAVGVVQGLAIIPGISRSGATIVCGMLFGLKRDLAARFSFILSIPAITGALILQLTSSGFESINIPALIIGTICSAVVGLAALKILMSVVTNGRLYYFAPYCWVVGLIIVILKTVD